MDMGKQGNPRILILVLVSSIIAIGAGAQEFNFLGFGSNESCANVDCMQGTCVPNDNALLSLLFPYTCKCNPGWSTFAKVLPFLEIPSLPCNVPNCTLGLNCSKTSPAPAAGPSAPITSANTSSCLIPGICGHGKCDVTSPENSLVPTFKCVCDPGYANVLNMTAGFCVNHCEIKGGCQNLNITLPGLRSPPPPPPPSPPVENQTANAGEKSVSFNSGFYVATSLIMGWSSLNIMFS